jgi:hypothetical protein
MTKDVEVAAATPKNKTWAERELEAVGYTSGLNDGPNKWMRDGVLELLDVFGKQGHSGFSAPIAIGLFNRLASHNPISPLTGEDDEWNDVGDGMWQNNRATNVFKDADGVATWIDGIVLWEWSTNEETGEKYKYYFTNGSSHVVITFPFTMPESPEYRERVTNDRTGN